MAKGKKLRIITGLTIISLSILILLVLNPKAQKYIFLSIARKIELKTGWQINVKNLKILPWEGAYLNNLQINYQNRQFFTSKRVIVSVSVSFKKPYIRVKKIYLQEPLAIIERSESGNLTFPPLHKTPDKHKTEPLDYSTILALAPEVTIYDGTLVMLNAGKNINVLARHINTSIEIPDNKTLWLKNLSASLEQPLVGEIAASGTAEFLKDTLRVKNFLIRNSSNLASMDGYINLRKLTGMLSGSMHVTNSQRASKLFFHGNNIGHFDSVFMIKIKPQNIHGDITINHKSLGTMNSLFNISLSHKGNARIRIKSRLDISNEKFSGKGFLNIKAAWKGRKDFYGIIKGTFKGVHLKKHRLDQLNVKAFITPKYLKLAQFQTQTEYGILQMQTNVSYEDLSKFDNNISIITRWQSKINVDPAGPLLTRGEIHATCTRKCMKDIKYWTVSVNAQSTYEHSSFGITGKLNNKKVNGLISTDNMPLQIINNIFKPSIHIQGVLSSRVQFSGNPVHPYVKARGEIKSARLGNVHAGAINFHFNGTIKGKFNRGTLKIKFHNLNVPEIKENIEELTINAEQNNRELNFNLEGTSNKNHYIFFQGTISNLWEQPSVILDKAVIKWEDFGTYKAASKLRILQSGLFVDYLNIYHSRGKIKARGILSKSTSSQLYLNFNDFPVADFFSKSFDFSISGGRINGGIGIKDERGSVIWNAKIKMQSGVARRANVPGSFSWQEISIQAHGNKNELTTKIKIDSSHLAKPCNITLALPIKAMLRWKGKRYIPDIKIVALDTQSIAGRINIPKAKLNLLQPFIPSNYEIKGLLSANLNIGGTLKQYRLEGTGNVQNASIVFPDKDYNISDINGKFSITNSTLKIRLYGKSLKGDFLIKGNLPVIPDLNNLHLDIVLKKISPPPFYGIRGKISGSGVLIGHEKNLDIQGKFKALKASLNLDKLNREVKKDISEIQFVEDNNADVIMAREKKSNFFKNRVRINVHIDFSKGKAQVRGMGVDSDVTGELVIKKKLGQSIQIFGEVKSIRGWYTFQSIRLKITKGIVRFRGLIPPDPELRITCEKKTRDATLFVNLTGSINEPSLKLTSTPPMSNVDILSYLLFNRPARQLTTRESVGLQEQAALFLGSKATKILKDILGKTPFSPDVIDFRQESSGSEILEVGKYLTPDFYVTYEKDVKDDKNDQVNIEYRINKHISIQSQLGGDNQGGIDILWRYDFGD